MDAGVEMLRPLLLAPGFDPEHVFGDKNADVTQRGDFPETPEGLFSPFAGPVDQNVSDVVSQGLVSQVVA